MANRFILIAGAVPELRERFREAVAALADFRMVLDRDGIILAASTDTTSIDLHDKGVIIGDLFTMGRPGPLAAVSGDTAATMAASGGLHLIERYWGGYVAVLLDDAGRPRVLRSPLGWLPCFFIDGDGWTAFSSEVALLVDAGLYRPRLDLEALARHMAAGDVRRDETCLSALRELRGGDCWVAAGGKATLWSPWSFADISKRLEDPIEALKKLRDTTLYCVAARSPSNDPSLLLLSGGLDSSIIAACLHAGHRSFTGMTYVTDNPSGDERRFARAVTDHLHATLLEGRCRTEAVVLAGSEAAHLPRPIARAFEQQTNALLRAGAAEIGAAAVVGGGGGDNIFCSLQSPAPAADCLLDPAGRAAFWKTASNIAELTSASVRTVAWRAWRRSRRPRAYRRPLELDFLSKHAIAMAEGALAHPWLAAPANTLPGKAAHVALLIGAQGFVEDSDPRSPWAVRAVLMAQPLVEACLQVPSWMWFERGRNRGAARTAFGGDLPAEIVWRRTKGTPDSFLIQLYEERRTQIRSLLVDGILAAHGLVDVPALLAELDDPRPAHGSVFGRIMQLVDIEVWTRHWPS